MLFDYQGREATKGARSVCGSCAEELIAKCGTIVTPHWAHRHADCDSWSEPESEWHREWKRWFRDRCNARIEVSFGDHRADVVLPGGTVVELQHGYLSPEAIRRRERYYVEHSGSLIWIYDARWMRRVESYDGYLNGEYRWPLEGERLWWKQAAKSLLAHRQSVYWDTHREFAPNGDSSKRLWRVELWPYDTHYRGIRILGRLQSKVSRSDIATDIGTRIQPSLVGGI